MQLASLLCLFIVLCSHLAVHKGAALGKVGTKESFLTSNVVFSPLSYPSNNISIVSFSLLHHRNGPWKVPDRYLHELRVYHNITLSSYACSLRFYAVGLRNAIPHSLQLEGIATLQLIYFSYAPALLYCHFTTSKHRGSDFIDSPKTLSYAIYCPVSYEMEMGEWAFKKDMPSPNYCRPLAEYPTQLNFTFYSSMESASAPETVSSLHLSSFQTTALTVPPKPRLDMASKQPPRHAICIVQNFQNSYSGYMLSLAVQYYHTLGWSVLLYDSRGTHYSFIQHLLVLDSFFYYPFTLRERLFPESDTDQNSTDFKYYYSFEHKGDHPGSQVSDFYFIDFCLFFCYKVSR